MPALNARDDFLGSANEALVYKHDALGSGYLFSVFFVSVFVCLLGFFYSRALFLFAFFSRVFVLFIFLIFAYVRLDIFFVLPFLLYFLPVIVLSAS